MITNLKFVFVVTWGGSLSLAVGMGTACFLFSLCVDFSTHRVWLYVVSLFYWWYCLLLYPLNLTKGIIYRWTKLLDEGFLKDDNDNNKCLWKVWLRWNRHKEMINFYAETFLLSSSKVVIMIFLTRKIKNSYNLIEYIYIYIYKLFGKYIQIASIWCCCVLMPKGFDGVLDQGML